MVDPQGTDPQGTYTVWHWPAAAAGAAGLAWDLTVLRDPGPTTYFWAHQWALEGGDAAYFGLQAHDRRHDGSVGKLAVFSVWSAVGCADNPGCHGGVEGAAARASSVWTELYGANVPGGVASCDLVPHSSVRFGVPAAEPRGLWGRTVVGRAGPGRTVAPTGHGNRLGDGDCANSRVADAGEGGGDGVAASGAAQAGGGGVVHEMGVPIRPLALLLGDVRAASAYRYDARDSLGNRMDTAKVIESPAGGYLAVYHSGRVCHLATSTDLMTWAHRAVVDEPATQPTIAAAPDGGFVTAAEHDDGHGGQLRIRYWPTLRALLKGRPARELLAARTLSACNEGTPSIRRVVLGPDVDSSTVELGFHYQWRCRVDRQARGRLTGFRHWSAAAEPEPDAAVERAAAAAGERVGGNIGGRDHVRYMGRSYDLIEAQGRRGDFGSWRVYLYDRAARAAQRVDVVTHRGSTAFANPTATCLRDPAGRNAVMVTLFVPAEGAAPGEAGSLLYCLPVDASGTAV